MIKPARSPLPALLLILFSLGVISGCTTTPEPEPEPVTTPLPPPDNPLIVLAKTDLAAARALNAEWLVLEPRVAALPVSLGAILAYAEAAQERGDTTLANALASKVSRLSRLGLVQAAEQRGASPYYPQ